MMEFRSYMLCIFSMIVEVGGICLDGFEHHGAHCYKVAALEASWMEAKMYCRLLGSDLAIIDDDMEENVVEGMLAKLHGSHIDEDYWIAGSDIINENSWLWMTTDGSSIPITYTKWAPGKPDNVGGNENCLAINYRKGRTSWNDYICNALHSFICETPVIFVDILPVKFLYHPFLPALVMFNLGRYDINTDLVVG